MTAALSPSRAADFKQCPLLFRFRTVDRLPSAPSAAAARGTLVHSVLEHIFDVPASQRTVEDALGLIEGCWSDLVEREPELATLVDAEGAPTRQEWFDAAASLIRTWFDLEDPSRLEPESRELYVETSSDGLLLRGYVDRLDVSPDGLMRVVDYKTGRSPGEGFEAKALFQMKFYALVLWRMRGSIPAQLQLVFLGNGEVVRYQPDERDLLALERTVHAIWDAVVRSARSGTWRASPSKLCGWCDYQDLCPEFGGTPPDLPPDALDRVLDPANSAAIDPEGT